MPETSLTLANQVYDAETGALVRRSEDDAAQARHLHRMVEMATLVKAVALARIADGKHFLDLGYGSMKEYAEDLPDGYRNVKRYIQVGRRFADMVPGLVAPKGTPVSLLEAKSAKSAQNEGSNCNENMNGAWAEGDDEGLAEGLEGLGLRKLLALTRLDEPAFEETVRHGQFRGADGAVYTVEDLTMMKSRQIDALIQEHRAERKAFQGRTTRQEEEIKKLKAERKADEEAVEAAALRRKEALDMEALYGKVRSDFDGVQRLLGLFNEYLSRARQALMQIDLDAGGPDSLRLQLHDAIAQAVLLADDARSYHGEVLGSVGNGAADALHQDRLIEEVFRDFGEPAGGVAGARPDEAEAGEQVGGFVEETAPRPGALRRVITELQTVAEDDTAALAKRGWSIESRQDEDGFSQSRLVNRSLSLETIWHSTFDVAVQHAQDLDAEHQNNEA